MTGDHSHCNENPQFPLSLNQWALSCWWPTESHFSGCFPFNLEHIVIVSLVEVRICLHECLPDLAATNSAILKSSPCCWISCASLKFLYELIGSPKTGWITRRIRNKASSCEEYAEKAIVSLLLMFGVPKSRTKIDGYEREVREVGRDGTRIVNEDLLAERRIGGCRANGDQIFMDDSMRRENGEGKSCQKKSKILRATHG